MEASCPTVSSPSSNSHHQILTVEQDGKSIYYHPIRDEFVLPSSKPTSTSTSTTTTTTTTTIPKFTIDTQSSSSSSSSSSPSPSAAQHTQYAHARLNTTRAMDDQWYPQQMVNPTMTYIDGSDVCHYPKPEAMCSVSTGPAPTHHHHLSYPEPNEQKPALLPPHDTMWSPATPLGIAPRSAYPASPTPYYSQPAAATQYPHSHPSDPGAPSHAHAHSLRFPYSQPGTPYSFADSPASSFEGSMAPCNTIPPAQALPYQHSGATTIPGTSQPLVDGIHAWHNTGPAVNVTVTPPSLGSTGPSLQESSPLPLSMDPNPTAAAAYPSDDYYYYYNANANANANNTYRPHRYLPLQPPSFTNANNPTYLAPVTPPCWTTTITDRDFRITKNNTNTTKPTRQQKDEFLVRAKMSGMTYRDIRSMGRFTEAESTLRGRFRTLTKRKEARVRKPEWSEMDEHLLKQAVCMFADDCAIGLGKIPWKKVAEYIASNGGTYHFGNATCRKKWDSLIEQGRHY